MNRHSLFAGILLMVVASFCHSQENYLIQSIVSSGSGKVSSALYSARSIAGQPATGKQSSANYQQSSGFASQIQPLDIAPHYRIPYESGWNMISVPVKFTSPLVAQIFPSANSSAFLYENGYQENDSLGVGRGYWLKFAVSDSTEVRGFAPMSDTINVAAKWNMIGSLLTSIQKSSIEALGTSVSSEYYTFSSESGYSSSNMLQPGKAYWVKVTTAGKLVLNRGSVQLSQLLKQNATASDLPQEQPYNTVHQLENILFKDANKNERTLYYSIVDVPSQDYKFELPPPAPLGEFDVRFSSQAALAEAIKGRGKQSFKAVIKGASFPLTVSWTQTNETERCELEITLKGVKKYYNMNEISSIRLEEEPTQVKLNIGGNGKQELPHEFALIQNYPNPFNPATMIGYELPKPSSVTLKVYNVLGEIVATLVNGVQDAGYKSVAFNAANFSSGVYMYKLTAESIDGKAKFTKVNRMMLLK